jgi:RND family efflux transporter MFP subunit
VEGFITRIVVRAGQRVERGSVLMEIDSNRQRAAVSSLESVRAARQADVQWARQQAERLEKLYAAGAVSQQEQQQAAIALQAAEAQLQAVEGQIAEQRVELAFHRVTAPTAGMVGDIPVRVGDRVTQSTLLTTIDERAGLELYLNVPVAQAPGLKPGLPVRIVDDSGRTTVATAVNFIAPSVDPETQAVLVKAPLDSTAPFRSDEFVRAHLVWSTDQGLTIPIVSVSRINGQYFGFVVEKGDNGATVARQRQLRLGAVVGNDYIVLSGLSPGEQLVVAGIQKIADGMPVSVTAAGGPAAPLPAPAGGR